MSYYNEFSRLGIDCPNWKDGKKKVICPKCNGGNKKEKSLYVYYESGNYQCHRASCGWRGWAGNNKEYIRPDWKNNTNLPAKVVRWFENRGISQNTLKRMKISVDGRNNIEFNYFRGDELLNIKTRFEIKGSKSFKQVAGAEKIVFNYNSLSGKEKCIFVEGEMDVLSWVEAGVSKEYAIISVDQGAGTPGSNLGSKLDCIKNCAEELDGIKEFYICTDKDAPGVWLQEELVRRFGKHRCSIVDLPKDCKDSNDVLQQEEFTIDARRQTLRVCLENATAIDLGGIHRLDEGVHEDMLDAYDNGRNKGKTTHYIEFDKRFTWLSGETTLFTGFPGMGKSQFLRMLMMLKSYFDGWKWACFVPEDMPVDYYYEDLCHIYTGLSSDKDAKNRVSRDEFINAMDFVKDHFIVIYPKYDKEKGIVELPSNEWINQRIRFLKLKYGVNAYLKDPWNKIYHNMGYNSREDQYLQSELTKEGFFAKEFDAACYVAHPKLSNFTKTKDGEYKVARETDISGGSMWNNMFDNIHSTHRPNRVGSPKDRTVEIHTLKIRKQKLVGRPGDTEFIYKRDENRYYETDPYGRREIYCPLEDEQKKIDDEDLPF